MEILKQPPQTSYQRGKVAWPIMLGAMTLLALGIGLASCRECPILSADFLASFCYSFCYAVGLWLVNGYPPTWIDRHASWTRQPLLRFAWSIGYALVASFLVIFLVSAAFQLFYYHQILRNLPWQRIFFLPLLFVAIISLFLHSRTFLLGWREAAIQTERLEKESAVARLDSLRRQVDPHFLFNSLNALTVLVEENDPARATRFIRQLAQVYRYVLDSQEREVVPLGEELAFVESYLHLQRTRLGEGIQVEIKQPNAATNTLLVPPLAVQLLLENALKHNATSQRNPLHITVEIDSAARELRVANTLRPRTVAATESTGLGLRNLQARYVFLSDQSVRIERTATEFIVALPLLTLG